jgi:peptide subunit release factor 1 (eRF1)
VEPLVRLHGADRSWAVLLANRRSARILSGDASHLTEVDTVADDVQGQHRQGGTEQARRQRHVEHQVDQHLRNVASALSRQRFDRLLVGAPHELRGRLEDALDTPSRARIAGEVEVDVEHATVDQVLEAARAAIEADGERREREALDRLKEGMGAAGRGAAGLEDSLAALNEQRVETLLINNGLTASGVRCPACDWLGGEGERCPADGSALERREDVLEDATERALAQSAEIFVIQRFEDLRPLGGVGAVLRF